MTALVFILWIAGFVISSALIQSIKEENTRPIHIILLAFLWPFLGAVILYLMYSFPSKKKSESK